MAKLVLCHVAKLSKIKQMWHLQMICSKFAIEVNPFFRPVLKPLDQTLDQKLVKETCPFQVIMISTFAFHVFSCISAIIVSKHISTPELQQLRGLFEGGVLSGLYHW